MLRQEGIGQALSRHGVPGVMRKVSNVIVALFAVAPPTQWQGSGGPEHKRKLAQGDIYKCWSRGQLRSLQRHFWQVEYNGWCQEVGEEAESDRRGPPLRQALCLTLVSSHLVAVLLAQSSFAHFIDEGLKAHKVNGGSSGESLHLVLLEENIFFF